MNNYYKLAAAIIYILTANFSFSMEKGKSRAAESPKVFLGNWHNRMKFDFAVNESFNLQNFHTLAAMENKYLHIELPGEKNPLGRWIYKAIIWEMGTKADNYISIACQYNPKTNIFSAKMLTVIDESVKLISNDYVKIDPERIDKITLFVNGTIEGDNYADSQINILQRIKMN